ncbi:MAG: hypothetical protein Q8910_06535 [Bacteroidota bacterium]|nr:hypothetical protein [Bacteroidota bacterium]
MADVKKAEKLALEAIEEEKVLLQREEKFALANPQFAEFLKQQKEIQAKIDDIKAQVKQTLIDAEYTDVLENDLFKISITKVSHPKVVDVDKVPKKYQKTQPDTDKIKKDFDLYGTLPEGVIDGSFYKLNWKVK